MKDFKKLKVWEKAHTLTLEIYRATGSFPKEELYGLTSQIRRASSSIPANIAEGYGRDSDAELRRFLNISSGSATELEYHLLLAKDLEFLPASLHQNINNELMEIQKMLAGLLRKIKVGN
ncbi:MAG: four helix bundle protein [Anaerolineae bacterium]|nr:four helix bundle protein [Anaerolineae bacterium]